MYDEKSQEKPNYYAIIPAEVRYDKSLPANAKLLYGEITALCGKEGFCWASNNYFSELYGVDRSSITHWIKKLSKGGYITIRYLFANGRPNTYSSRRGRTGHIQSCQARRGNLFGYFGLN